MARVDSVRSYTCPSPLTCAAPRTQLDRYEGPRRPRVVVPASVQRAKQRLGATLALVRGPSAEQREYRRAFAALALNQLGDGLAAGGLFILVDVLGVVSHSLSMGCMVTLALVETLVGVLWQGYAALMRDEAADNAARNVAVEAGKQAARRRLVKSGVADSLLSLGLLVTALAVSLRRLRPAVLFGALTALRAGQTANLSYETGAYHSLRNYLVQDVRRRNMDGTLSWMEFAVGCTLMEVGRWGTYMVALALSGYGTGLFLSYCIGSLAVSVLLTGVPKMLMGKGVSAKVE